jgi:hypothetical protein
VILNYKHQLLKDFQKKLAAFKSSNHVALFYEFGMTPEDIKSAIIDTFGDYFRNNEVLKEEAVNSLVNSWLSYLTIQRDYPELLHFIQKVLDIFNGAKIVNEIRTVEAYLIWLPELNQSISRFWSLYNNQSNIFELCIEDFVEESLGIIGQSIEGLAKPFLKLLVHSNRIRRNKPINLLELQSKDLGVLIDELINTSDLQDLLILQPNSIRLNQWRNIAYHHNSKVLNGRIFCNFKRNGQQEEFEITKAELFMIVKRILGIFKLIRLSQTIFCIDNIYQIQTQSDSIDTAQINIREESKLLDFYSSLSSQGFCVTDLKYDNDIAKLDIHDMEEYSDFEKRGAHSSQFLYNLWIFTSSSHLIINYYLYSGEKFLTSEIASESFSKYSGTEVKLSILLDAMRFTFISPGFKQDKDPFRELQLSEEVKSHPQIFYSQLGEVISIEEFIKQFILSVFCNYISLKSEGLEDIKINIGSDGSLARTAIPKGIILHVPAPIENKALQVLLLKTLENVIDLYEAKELKRELVVQAKLNNQFYQKKDLIKNQLQTAE